MKPLNLSSDTFVNYSETLGQLVITRMGRTNKKQLILNRYETVRLYGYMRRIFKKHKPGEGDGV